MVSANELLGGFQPAAGQQVQDSADFRQSHKTSLLGKRAGFTDPNACVKAIDYRPERGLDKKKILSLATCGYVAARHHVLLHGHPSNHLNLRALQVPP